MTRRWPIVALVLLLTAVGGLGQAATFYTDWLWFAEVQYTDVLLTLLLTRATLVAVAALAIFTGLYVNARYAVRGAAPDVLWELDNLRQFPGRALLELTFGRALPVVLAIISLLGGFAAGRRWATVLDWWYQVPFGVKDPLFERDVAFFVFTLPACRLLVAWTMGITVAALFVAALVHVLRGSIALATLGPRLSAGARIHLLLLGALVLVVKAVDFWLDRFELVYSARGVVFGASYTDVHASLPVLSALAVLALAAAVALVLETRRAGWRLAAPALAVIALAWVVGLGVYPALLRRLRVTPNELVAERPFIAHHDSHDPTGVRPRPHRGA